MWLYILVGVIGIIIGLLLGFLVARKYMMDYIKKNPPINEKKCFA